MISKKISQYFIMLAYLALSLGGCVTEEDEAAVSEVVEVPDKSDAETAKEPNMAPEPKSFAIPISPELTSEYPHLSGFEGELLIGNRNFHAILAGIPLSRTLNLPFKGIHSLYRFQNGQWRKVRIWDIMTFERQNRKGEFFTPVGLNVETKGEHSVATIVFAPSSGKSPQIKLKFHSFARNDWIIVENTAADIEKNEDHFWKARWTSLFGEQIAIRESETESPAILRFFEDESVAYIGPIEPSGQISLLPDTLFKIFDYNHSVSSVSHLFVGQNETKEFKMNTALHKKCLNDFKVTGGPYAIYKSVNIDSYVKCFSAGAKVNDNITLSNGQPYPSRNFLVSDKSQKVNFIYLGPKSEVKVSSQREKALQMENAVSTRRTTFTPTKSPGEIRALLDEFGSARVLKPSGLPWEEPTLVRLQSHISPNSVSVTPNWKLERLGVNLWKFEKWPMEGKLATGYYRLEAVNLHRNKTCNAVFEIKKDIVTEVVCQLKNSNSQDSFTANFELPQLLHRLENYVGQDGFQIAANGDDINKKVIWATSSEHRLKFRVFPVNQDIIDKWKNFKKENSQESEFNLLGQFGELLGERVTRELLCPYSQTSEVAFSAAIRRTKPNALQLFGCENLEFANSDAIETARKVNGVVPVILPASNNNPLVPLSGFATFVTIDSNPANQVFIPNEIFESLSNESRYTLSKGAILRVNTPISNMLASPASQTSTEIAFDLEVKALWPYKITGLEVHHSDGSVYKRKIDIDTGEYAITKFRSTISSENKWLQIHIVGRIIEEYPGLRDLFEKEKIIASSSPFIFTSQPELNN